MDWGSALAELAKASPFALMCVFSIWIITSGYKKQLQTISEINDKTVSSIKDAYSDSLIQTREALKDMRRIYFGEDKQNEEKDNSQEAS